MDVYSTSSLKLSWFGFLIILVPFLSLLLASIYRRYLQVGFGYAWLVSIASFAAFIFAIMNYPQFPLVGTSKFAESQVFKTLIPGSMIVFFAIPFALMLHRKWIGNHVTEQEKIAGIEGVRAWLCAGNLICCFGMAFCAWRYFYYPPLFSTFVKVLIASIGALFVYPVINMLSLLVSDKQNHPADHTAARDKILELLEAGKITAPESVELLSALYDKGSIKEKSDETRISS